MVHLIVTYDVLKVSTVTGQDQIEGYAHLYGISIEMSKVKTAESQLHFTLLIDHIGGCGVHTTLFLPYLIASKQVM